MNGRTTITKTKGERVYFTFHTDDLALANMLRRSIISEVPTYSIDVAIFNRNNSSRVDEILAFRFGQLVIDNTQLESKENDTYTLDVSGPKIVTASDIQGLPFVGNPVIIELQKGEHINCDLLLRQDIGRTHQKFSPVCLCTAPNKVDDGYSFTFKNLGMLSNETILELGLAGIETAARRPFSNLFMETSLPKNFA